MYEHVAAERMYRETGIYRHDGAEAEVEINNSGKAPAYFVKMTGKKMESCKELFRRIKTGTIRPEESYEGRQQGKSRVELEDELTQTKSSLDLSKADLSIAQDRVREARRLAETLSRAKWPWCRNQTVAAKINLALNAG